MIQPSLSGLSSMMNNFPTIGFGPNSLAGPSFWRAEPWWATFMRPLRGLSAGSIGTHS
jgi:hypothetical protein